MNKPLIATLCGIAILGSVYTIGYALRSIKDTDLLSRALIKADKNQDGLQKQEISDLLKQLNTGYVLSDDANTLISTTIEKKSRITYFNGKSHIVLGRKDLEKYLQQ